MSTKRVCLPMGFARASSADEDLKRPTKEIQPDLFRVGSAVATPPESRKGLVPITAEMVEGLTQQVHEFEAIDGLLSDWSIPGEQADGAAFDPARTIRRRMEEHKGSRSEELRRMRPVAKAAFWEQRPSSPTNAGGCGGRSWGLRFWNGYGEQMTSVFLPNPHLTDEMRVLKQPDWSRLDLYYRLRAEFLGEAIPSDYEAAAHMPLPASIAR